MALFVTRSTRAVDTTGPSAPTITATPASTSTITIQRTANASDPSGILNYETQRSLQGVGSWTSFDTSNTNPLTAAGLSAATAYDFRQRAYDTFGNVGSFSSTVSATTQGGTNEVFGSYANLDLSNQQIYRIDANAGDTPRWQSEGGTVTTVSSGNVDGGPYYRVRPIPVGGGATGQGNVGVGGFNFRNRGVNIRKLNCRWEQRFGSSWITEIVQMDKWFIVNAGNTQNDANNNGERPMGYLSDMDTQAGNAPVALQRNDLMAVGIASGTVKNFESLESGFAGFNWPRGNEPFLWGPSDTTISGKRIVDATQWYTCELEVIGSALSNWPLSPTPVTGSGLIRIVIWNRANEILADLRIPWNWDTNWSAGNDFMLELEVIGGYMNAVASPSANNYMDIANVTLAANRDGLILPRAAFLS